MSWVKNLWSRMFPEDTEEDYEEVEKETSSASSARPQRAPFRFPVITDEEKGSFIKQNPRNDKLGESLRRGNEQQTAPRRRPVNPAIQRALNYDAKTLQEDQPETLRERIPVRNREPVQDFESIRTYEPRSYEAPKPAVHSYEPPVPPKSRKYEAPTSVKKTRRFEPTRVPSPIYGYNDTPENRIHKPIVKKATTFEQLKNDEKEVSAILAATKAPALNFAPETVEEPEAMVPQPTDNHSSDQAIELLESKEEKKAVEMDSTSVRMDETASPNQELTEEVKAIESVPETTGEEMLEPDSETIEAPAIELPAVPAIELREEKREEKELNESNNEKPVHTELEATSESSIKTVTPVEKREKTVPFNVLMLKSDKERVKKPSIPAASPAIKNNPDINVVEAEPASDKKQAPTDDKKLEVNRQMMSEVLSAEKEPETEHPEALELETLQDVETVTEVTAYEQPGTDYLRPPENDLVDEVWMEEQGERLIEALSHFQIQASILSIVQGPAVTQFEVTVAQGVKVSKIRNLADDLKLALAAKDIRIQAPIPGKSSIGIEIPNRKSRAVRISEVIESRVFSESESPLEAALGLDLTGKPVTLDLRKMPHGLIAGATGSGKSVCINSLLVSLLYKSSPRDLKLLLIDPKMVELAPYNHIPHLVSPVITDVKAATASLKWAVEEMERRYQLFAHAGVRDLNRYNKMVEEKGDYAQHLPYILIVIDELADLMMMSPSDVEDAICRIAQKARACGIHLVIATQRPSVDVITGLIKSNIPTRIAFSVSSQVDSRTILDTQGAERLLGRGDMLYLGNGMSAPVRIQGTFVTDEEIEDVIAHVRAQGEPEYFFKEEELIKRASGADFQDDLFEEACRFIMTQGSASTSLLQRKFHIGYNRAARLMDLLEQHGFISEQNGSKARAVLMTEEDIAEVFQ
ncbi:DNA translocase FtsK [Planococcus sp. NCCP-2050]|uniref:DNA translocase FtsK n=1 Tax=Planococcus sp. NCCP-2050 TaxID=2944679 RepID=UPI00203C2F45|nr:DNA translocase FtsK [Planococcus sp. NCCP-2050]GKW46656.1 DNA translocase FtsK [Planococcus sp. NCCP-2050]